MSEADERVRINAVILDDSEVNKFIHLVICCCDDNIFDESDEYVNVVLVVNQFQSERHYWPQSLYSLINAFVHPAQNEQPQQQQQ